MLLRRTILKSRRVVSCFRSEEILPLPIQSEIDADRRPLLSLLSGQKPTSVHTSARIGRWSLALSMFEYNLQFRNTTAHSNADALCCLPLMETAQMTDTPPELVLLVDHFDSSPITADQIKDAT